MPYQSLLAPLVLLVWQCSQLPPPEQDLACLFLPNVHTFFPTNLSAHDISDSYNQAKLRLQICFHPSRLRDPALVNTSIRHQVSLILPATPVSSGPDLQITRASVGLRFLPVRVIPTLAVVSIELDAVNVSADLVKYYCCLAQFHFK
ncbi:unnamed protein product [Protopolystoma xenopodis]|uniref:Uncharacterized protein n=1 Tax=Protopolystoma xenopodis TaxID=117903 RepID=A0A448WJ66_9PLAT|nr:unnamed protein product [Protopolystoma xenopodis]